MMRWFVSVVLVLVGVVLIGVADSASDDSGSRDWRPLPLTQDGSVHPDWAQIGWGRFSVVEGSLRTDCDPQGMGLLLYKKERFGNCQFRIVYRTKDGKSNSGIFVRIDEGIIPRLNEKAPAVGRNPDGSLSDEMVERLKEASEKELGPWYAVHHGYEVQIKDADDEFHRTGAIYSFARAARVGNPPAEGWRTMLITVRQNQISVDIDGQRICTFDSDGRDIPAARKWYEPKREPKRPQVGYFGLQNHDPGDVVWFKEISVRDLKN